LVLYKYNFEIKLYRDEGRPANRFDRYNNNNNYGRPEKRVGRPLRAEHTTLNRIYRRTWYYYITRRVHGDGQSPWKIDELRYNYYRYNARPRFRTVKTDASENRIGRVFTSDRTFRRSDSFRAAQATGCRSTVYYTARRGTGPKGTLLYYPYAVTIIIIIIIIILSSRTVGGGNLV